MSTDNQHNPPMDVADLRQFFEDTYESLQSEHGYGLDQDALRDAWRHIEFYWRKLEVRVANRITETEVPLTLMNQKTPKGRPFAIHGVIDVVEENNQVTLYDIKSHELRRIQENVDRYAPQLEVYAHIWTQLRGKPVHQTCIIATDPPSPVKRIVDRYSCRAYREFARQVGGTAANAMEFYLDHGMTRDEVDDRRDNYISVLNDRDEDDDAIQNVLIE
jgi:hypothetical protein